MTTLLELLTELKVGLTVQIREDLESSLSAETLKFQGGKWLYGRDETDGYGRSEWVVIETTREQALKLLREKISREIKEETSRQSEIAWLDQAIADLTTVAE